MSMLNFICSNSLIVLSTLMMYHPGHLRHFLQGNQNKMGSKIVRDINKLQLEPKIRCDDLMIS